MAVLDWKNSTIKLWDGVLRTATMNSAAMEADLVFTEKSRHNGSYPPSVRFVDPGMANQALSVTVSGRDITVNLATSAMSAITSTAAQVKAAIEANATANALVTVAYDTGEDGTGIVSAIAKTTLSTGSKKSITVKSGNGNLTYTESKPREFTLDRGTIDSVRNANEEPVAVTLDTMFEYIKASTGGTETVEDALKQRGEASDWVSTADDQCQPYCVDIEITNDFPCAATEDEVVTLEEFYYESIPHDFQGGTINITGRCNRLEASIFRVPV